MSNNYWEECISIAAEECSLEMTPEQLVYLVEAVEIGHDNQVTIGCHGEVFRHDGRTERVQ